MADPCRVQADSPDNGRPSAMLNLYMYLLMISVTDVKNH